MSLSGQAPAGGSAAATGPAPKTAWGHPDLQGIWLDEFDTPLERPARYANKEFFTDEERAAQDDARSGNIGRDPAGAREPAGRRRRIQRGVHLGEADGPTDVTGRRAANGRIPALTPQAQERNRLDREFRLALLQNTDTCKSQVAGLQRRDSTGRPRRASPKCPRSTTRGA